MGWQRVRHRSNTVPCLPPHTLSAGNGSWGQLGNGRGSYRAGSYTASTPVQVLGGRSFASVCTGDRHSCGLDSTGKAWCWGLNDSGQKGTGTTYPSATPVEVSGGLTYTSITCGSNFTCALDAEGQAWCWGESCWGVE